MHTYRIRRQIHSGKLQRYDAFVFIGAMGICVRTIAPCVKNKYTDPAVICVDSTGKFAISVLSGHIGGANELTHQVANILGAEPVVTTQSDCTGLWGLDTLPQRFGWFPVINAEPSTLLLAELAKTPEEKKRVCMNEHISLFVSGKPPPCCSRCAMKVRTGWRRTCRLM